MGPYLLQGIVPPMKRALASCEGTICVNSPHDDKRLSVIVVVESNGLAIFMLVHMRLFMNVVPPNTPSGIVCMLKIRDTQLKQVFQDVSRICTISHDPRHPSWCHFRDVGFIPTLDRTSPATGSAHIRVLLAPPKVSAQ